ncbi:phage shock protein operon transcriptional activator [Luminiphilus sp.]|nr:phage shock protein operon transcriptional activator [Luminiphilus sp.]
MEKIQQNMIGESPALMAALDHLSSLASIDRPVLILGERGTGKELAAERLHFLSPRWSGVFVKINCGAITETLLESELFGHEAGAFTGATKQHIGRFERADNGTLFLDELGTMSLRLQEKLLRLIEYGEFERVGGSKTLQVDVRIIAATNVDLPKLADAGKFRWDLLDRMTFDVVRLPPLRERQGDIAELAHHFAVKMVAELGWPLFRGFSEVALEAIMTHGWPGNIRELKNVVERSVYRWGDQENPIDAVVINPFHSFDHDTRDSQGKQEPPEEPKTSPLDTKAQTSDGVWPMDLRQALHRVEHDWLTSALEEANQSQKIAAQLLGLSYDQMRSLMRKHGLRTRSSRGL